MGKGKRNQKAIQDRAAKRRKQEDAQLLNGGFQEATELLDDEVLNVDIDVRQRGSSWENEEQDYEMRPRKLQEYGEDMVEGLPIKINGKIERKMHKKQSNTTEENDNGAIEEELDRSSDASGQAVSADEKQEEEFDEEPDTEERIIELKEEIAELVEKIIEEPEENTAALTRLCKMAEIGRAHV